MPRRCARTSLPPGALVGASEARSANREVPEAGGCLKFPAAVVITPWEGT